VVDLIMKKFNIQRWQAYADIRSSERLFNSVSRVDKDFYKRWLIEDMMLLIVKAKGQPRKMDEDGNMAEAKETDFKAWNSAHTNLIKLLGFDRKEEDLPDPSIFEQHNYFTVVMVNGKPQRMDNSEFLSLPVAKKNQLVDALFAPITEDIAFEMLDTGDENGEDNPEE